MNYVKRGDESGEKKETRTKRNRFKSYLTQMAKYHLLFQRIKCWI